jgi:hypothetical protein
MGLLPRVVSGLVAFAAAVLITGAAGAQSDVGDYGRLSIKPAGPVLDDSSFEPFRARSLEMARAQDWAGLQTLLGPSFFWDRDFGGAYDPAATPATNFASAFSLSADSSEEGREQGWQELRSIFELEGAVEHGDGNFCLPGEWAVDDEAAATEVAERRGGVWPFDLGVVTRRDVPVYADPASDTTVGTLSEEAVRILASGEDILDGSGDRIRVALASGAEGFVSAGEIDGLVDPRLCFAKVDGEWRISGYVGGGD